MLALSNNHKLTVPSNDLYGSYPGSEATLLIRSHVTKIEMQAVLSKKNEEYKSAKKHINKYIDLGKAKSEAS